MNENRAVRTVTARCAQNNGPGPIIRLILNVTYRIDKAYKMVGPAA